ASGEAEGGAARGGAGRGGGRRHDGLRRDRRAEFDHAHRPERPCRRERERAYYRDAGARRQPMKVNPITVEVARNAVNAYADEMARALCKSAYNMMIYEVRDFCCGLIDGEGRMISQNKGGLPIFLAAVGIAR